MSPSCACDLFADHDQDNTVPDEAAIRSRLPLVDYRAIEIDDRAGTVF